jgi:hypothetical protein
VALECLFPDPGRGIPEPHLALSYQMKLMQGDFHLARRLQHRPNYWPSSVRLQAPVATVQSCTVVLDEADARTLPSGEKATALNQQLWPSSVCCQAPEVTSQSRIVSSMEADARALPSGEKAIALTQLLCFQAPEVESQSRTVLSSGLMQGLFRQVKCYSTDETAAALKCPFPGPGSDIPEPHCGII